MAGWLQKILMPPAKIKGGARVPAKKGAGNLPSLPLSRPGPGPQTLPNATVIYGIGASLLFVASFFLLVSGRWFTALVVFAVGGCLTGFALHLLKHQD